MADTLSEPNPTLISPRNVANKRSKEAFKQAIRMALAVESEAVRHNTQTFNRNRYRAIAEIEEYEALKDRARAIKERAIENLPALLTELEAATQSNGGHLYLAEDAADACHYVREVCRRHRAASVVKSKSMTTEEIKLNHVLEGDGIEVVETDLAEFILQIADEPPAHIAAPAIHYSRERISALFKRTFDTDLPLDTGEELTKFARDRLREKFLQADVGITGANVIAADSGTLLLVESEANIRMVTMAPPVHVAIAGVEKVVPTRADLTPFIELIAPSGTGQPLTSYTSVISPPLDVPAFSFGNRAHEQREFHLVLIDNGRMHMREDPYLREALYCVRCSACLNVCANFQAVGGHAFGGETYSGGIGGAWEAGTGQLENARFNELCTGCTRCVPQCPVRIDIPWLNAVLRDRLNRAAGDTAPDTAGERSPFPFLYKGLLPSVPLDKSAPFEKQFFGNYHFFARWASRLAPVSNWFGRLSPSRLLLEKAVGLDRRRRLPAFARTPLTARSIRSATAGRAPGDNTAVLFADVFTTYGSPERGVAAIELLQAVGIDVVLSEMMPAGRSAVSQGMIATATERARVVAAALDSYIDAGHDVIVVEPSVLALFRYDYRRLLADDALFETLKRHTYGPIEYLHKVAAETGAALHDLFDAERAGVSGVFYHAHCQQKTIGAAHQTETLLRALGFEVETSQVECCGMAGSFGYKKAYYEVSMAVGADLFAQIEAARAKRGDMMVLAGGTSCCEQIEAGIGVPVLHPVEFLAGLL